MCGRVRIFADNDELEAQWRIRLKNIYLFSYWHTIHILSLDCTSCSFAYTRQLVPLIRAQNRYTPDDYIRVFAADWVLVVYCLQLLVLLS